MSIIRFIKNWSLPVSMTVGVVSYFVYVNIHALDHTHQLMNDIISVVQPGLIFMMLFFAFCKVEPKALRPHAWQLKLIGIQTIAFVMLALPVIMIPTITGRVIIESAMICVICPTATAASVVTTKLHGNTSCVVSYTCVINLIAALLIPAVVSLLHSGANNLDFITSFSIIIGRVFPLLILPLLLAFGIRYMLPKFHRYLASISYISFHLWTVSLAISIAIATKAIVHSHETAFTYWGIAIVSMIACALQFYLGRVVGRHHGEPIAGAQSLGQKNTAFAIWVAYTFMNPVTALAGGFYLVWHNIVNSWQLYRERVKSQESRVEGQEPRVEGQK